MRETSQTWLVQCGETALGAMDNLTVLQSSSTLLTASSRM